MMRSSFFSFSVASFSRNDDIWWRLFIRAFKFHLSITDVFNFFFMKVQSQMMLSLFGA